MSENKVLGLEPAKYVKIAYILLLVSSAIGVLTSLMALVGIFTVLGGIASLAGIIGLLMAVIGWAGFKDSFSGLGLNHLKYIVILFLAFLVIGIIVGAIFLMSPVALYGASLVMGAIQLVLVYTGYNSWGRGRSITKDNLKDEVRAALNRA